MLAAVLLFAGSGCGTGSSVDQPPIVGESDAGGGAQPDAGGEPADAATGASCDTTPSLVLGSGVQEWLNVKDGDTLYLFRGPQGGYMVYLSVRAKGINPADATVCYDEYIVDTGVQAGKGCWRVELTNDLGDGVHERLGIWGQIDSQLWTQVSQVRGHTMRVKAVISDAKGCSASAGWTVNISPDKPM